MNGSIEKFFEQPVLSLGDIGSFDENGTSYPSVLKFENKFYMYYTGWIQGVQIPWYNNIGLAKSNDGIVFKKVSKAPIISCNNYDYIGLGSCYVLKEDKKWHIWYTRFENWKKVNGMLKHFYNIKYADSTDGINWSFNSRICINFKNNFENSISKPCIKKIGDNYYMWYSFRGKYYKPGFAVSKDGKKWKRIDEKVGISKSDSGWDSEMLCYPNIFEGKEYFYMFYNGNDYGKQGLGYARISKELISGLIYV